MKIDSLSEIKKELTQLSEKQLVDIITELAKFSAENKKLLFFKLQGQRNPQHFLDFVTEELDIEFQKANTGNYHLAKKSAQSIRRKLNKIIKLTKHKPDQIELIIFFCEKLKAYGYLTFRHPVITNLYQMQLGKIDKLISGLHEDLQYDYEEKIRELRLSN